MSLIKDGIFNVFLLLMTSIMTSEPILLQYSAMLTTSFGLYWGLNSTHILIDVHADATGWVGIGVSSNRAMSPGDVCMGYVNGQQSYIGDYYTRGHQEAIKDTQQDCSLSRIEEIDGRTSMRFYRKLDTGDSNDIPIREGATMNVIYAASNKDPISNSHFGHHSFSGVKPLVLVPTGSLLG